jgi:hypothetical protein
MEFSVEADNLIGTIAKSNITNIKYLTNSSEEIKQKKTHKDGERGVIAFGDSLLFYGFHSWHAIIPNICIPHWAPHFHDSRSRPRQTLQPRLLQHTSTILRLDVNNHEHLHLHPFLGSGEMGLTRQ